MNKKDLAAALLASALGGAAFVAPVMADEVNSDPVDIQDQVEDTSESVIEEDNSTDVAVNSLEETANDDSDTVIVDENSNEISEVSNDVDEIEAQSQKDGWTEDKSQYYENGELVKSQFKEIDGNTYYFDEYGDKCSGYCTVDGDFYCFDDNGIMQKNYLDSGNFWYFGADGKQIKSKWQYIEGKGWMYFNEGGYCYRGYYDEKGEAQFSLDYIDGEYYLFDVNGIMQTNKESGGMYFEEDGKALKNAWKKYPNGYKYYSEYGWQISGWTGSDGVEHPSFNEIDGKYYCFDVNGYMVTGWVKSYDNWYYYNQDGSQAFNQWINNTYYVNENGWMVKDTWVDSNNYVGSDGKKTTNKWEYVSGKWKYKLGDNAYATNKMCLINGHYYAFGYDGIMLQNELCWIQNFSLNETSSGYVRADKNGYLTKGWYKNEYNYWYYFGDNYLAYDSGFYDINGKKYYFSNYIMKMSTVFVNGGKLYQADSNGYVTDVDTSKKNNVWGKYESQWYYFKNGKIVTSTFETINNKKYYFSENGAMASDSTFAVAGKYYYADSDGVVIEKKNTWYLDEYDRYLYYKEDGSLVVDSFYTVGNKKYHFNSNGFMDTGIFSVSGYDENNSWIQNTYYANRDGAVQNTVGWIYHNFTYYYVGDSEGHLLKNTLKEIKGKKYYFAWSGAMATSGKQDINGDIYYFDTNGSLVDNLGQFNGWKLFHGEWYYSKDGNRYYSGKVGNYFVNNGKMVVNSVVNSKGWTYASASDGDNYYVDYNGEIQKGWIQTNGTWLYADPSTGKLTASKWLKIGSQWYYFSGYNMVTGYFSIDGVINKFNSDGVWQGTLKSNSWIKDEEGWLYINENGKFNQESKKIINGVTYYFTGYGKGATMGSITLAENCAWYDGDSEAWYWTNKTGTGLDKTTGWKKSNDGYYAYCENGKLVTGLKTIGGKTYYFGYGGYLDAGITNYKGKAYVADENGNLLNYKEGWNAYGNQWYYIQNGKALTNTTIDGYYLGYDGLTTTGMTYNGTENILVVNGKLAKNQWVYCGNNIWYYADASGHFAKNQWIGNYYVDNYGRMVTNAWIGNYHVDANGKWDATK